MYQALFSLLMAVRVLFGLKKQTKFTLSFIQVVSEHADYEDTVSVMRTLLQTEPVLYYAPPRGKELEKWNFFPSFSHGSREYQTGVAVGFLTGGLKERKLPSISQFVVCPERKQALEMASQLASRMGGKVRMSLNYPDVIYVVVEWRVKGADFICCFTFIKGEFGLMVNS